VATKLLFCPKCKKNLKEAGVDHILYGATVTDVYTYGVNGWQLKSSETNDPDDAWYTCSDCGEKLPDELQEYFSNNL